MKAGGVSRRRPPSLRAPRLDWIDAGQATPLDSNRPRVSATLNRREGVMRAFFTAALLAGVFLSATATRAVDITGTVSFNGMVVFAAPIPGIAANDLVVSPKTTSEATDPGESCTVNTITSDSPDVAGAYPDAGTVTANITLHHGGMVVPNGRCILTLT